MGGVGEVCCNGGLTFAFFCTDEATANRLKLTDKQPERDLRLAVVGFMKLMYTYASSDFVCVCVCVRERERERERTCHAETGKTLQGAGQNFAPFSIKFY